MPTSSPTSTANRSEKLARITEMDVLRGFALFGITLVNTVGITRMPTSGSTDGLGHWVYEALLHQRFFPIFSLLFGLSFGLFLDAVRDRAQSPRLLMLARLGFLIPFGALHRLLQPREVLLTYAIVGIVVLLPASFLPGWRLILTLGGIATVAATLAAGGSALVPGLFLVGFAASRYGVEKLLALPTTRIRLLLAVTATLAVALNVLQISRGVESGSLPTTAGLATAATYTTALVLLVRSRIRRTLCILAPLGRTTLTSYIAATLLILAADQLLKIGTEPNYGMAFLLGTGVFLVEMALSMLWLSNARYGPFEWVWRCLTWWQAIPNYRKTVGRVASPPRHGQG